MTNFIELAQKAFAEGSTMEDKAVLWKAVFDLEQWHSIARGELPNVGPYISYLEEDKPVIFLFTDTANVRATAIKRELHTAEENTPILSFPSAKAVDYLMQFEQDNIWGVWFNADSECGFYSPLQNLPAIKRHIENL